MSKAQDIFIEFRMATATVTISPHEVKIWRRNDPAIATEGLILGVTNDDDLSTSQALSILPSLAKVYNPIVPILSGTKDERRTIPLTYVSLIRLTQDEYFAVGEHDAALAFQVLKLSTPDKDAVKKVDIGQAFAIAVGISDGLKKAGILRLQHHPSGKDEAAITINPISLSQIALEEFRNNDLKIEDLSTGKVHHIPRITVAFPLVRLGETLVRDKSAEIGLGLLQWMHLLKNEGFYTMSYARKGKKLSKSHKQPLDDTRRLKSFSVYLNHTHTRLERAFGRECLVGSHGYWTFAPGFKLSVGKTVIFETPVAVRTDKSLVVETDGRPLKL
jgi:hypothetical protein